MLAVSELGPDCLRSCVDDSSGPSPWISKSQQYLHLKIIFNQWAPKHFQTLGCDIVCILLQNYWIRWFWHYNTECWDYILLINRSVLAMQTRLAFNATGHGLFFGCPRTGIKDECQSLHEHTQKLVSWAILNPVKLTIKFTK